MSAAAMPLQRAELEDVSPSPAEALRLPPHSIEAERSVLGGVLLQNSSFDGVAEIVEERDFYSAQHKAIWRAVAYLVEAGQPADVLTVRAELDRRNEIEVAGGVQYLHQIAQGTPSTANIRTYAGMVRGSAIARRGAQIGASLRDALLRPGVEPDAPLRDAEDALAALGRAGAATWPDPLDLEALAGREPESPEYLIPDWLPAGYAAAIFGHGGTGKSQIAGAMLAICIAAGIPYYGLPVQRRRVTVLACEDREKVLHWRLARACAYLGIDMASLRGWLNIFDLVAHDALLWAPRGGGVSGTTKAYNELQRTLRRYPTDVLLIDGISDTYGGNLNDPQEVKRFVRSLLPLIPAERGAVVLIGHVDKVTARNHKAANGQGYSGAAQWHNAMRARWFLFREGEGSDDDAKIDSNSPVILKCEKSQYGKDGDEIRLRWNSEAHVFIAEQQRGTGYRNLDRITRERDELAGIMAALRECLARGYVPAATTGPRTAYHVLSACDSFPAGLKGGASAAKRRFWAHIETLRLRGEIIEQQATRPGDRHKVPSLALGLAAGNA